MAFGNADMWNQSCLIIAEIGVNHLLEPADMQRLGYQAPLDVAIAMIDIAKAAGVDAVKFQTFTADTLQFRGTPIPGYMERNIGTVESLSYYDLIKKYETSRDDQRQIARYCAKAGIIFFSTPYDRDSVDFLDEDLDVPFFKLASFELTNHLFIKYVAGKGKPIILSTGLSDMADVRETVTMARKNGFGERLVLMQCTSDYPTPASDVNLNVLKTYLLEFPDVIVGLSDHYPGLMASVGAVVIGARALEKHFTLDVDLSGPDHSASLDPSGLKAWVAAVREMQACLGSFQKAVTPAEEKNLAMKRYLVISPNPAGTILTEEMLTTMRTGTGVPAKQANLDRIIGQRLTSDVGEPTPFSWDLIASDSSRP